MSQRINMGWIGGPANSLQPLAVMPFSFGDLDSQLPWGTLRVIDDPSAAGGTIDSVAEAVEVIATISDPENREAIPWERIKRDLKL